ncbi:hypothetical protein BD626DRAFT_400336 [Schizophyllum amplum]|uniref:Xylanolytic transcriptional activator regulatory domain-containing protein n=1 Tax=Schizophyllum amplum TaxID=97359 RepID=A0A550CJ08_9AGAR|nr:hypothetical protein BD626DRAFT_400336 [Auriculariopsis ampla]
MAQLEQVGQTPRSYAGSSSAHTSPMISPSSFSESDVTSPQESVNPAVEEWIARARERFAEFDDFISVAGSAPISYVVQDDPEHSDEDSEGAEYDFTVVPADGATSESFSRHLSSALPPAPKKRDSGQKLATLPSEAAPYGLMANLSLKAHPRRANSTGEMASPEEGKDLSIANDDFFRSSPGPDPERARQAMTVERPPILTRGIITPAEAESLFKIYFDTMNQSVSLLDPVLYTAPKTCYRSPFLFTVICALASRFHPKQPEIYPQLMRYAHLAAGTALISGPKTVDLCHAFILLALYPTPAKRWEDDRSWIFLGTAIRIAMDLNLQYPNTAKPQNENHAREMLNRTRVWINCYNLDRSMGSQYGKAPVIYQEDYMATHSQDWWQSNPYNMANFDIHLCAYNAELRALSGFIRKVYSNPDHPTGLNKEVDLEKLSMETDDEIQALSAKWMGIIEQTDMDDPQNRFRTGLLRLAWSYARLAVLSYGFQHAFGKNNADENPFLLRCFTAAKDVVTAVVDGLGQSSQRIYLRHGPEAQKVFVTFAASFLVKLLQPKFASYLSYERRLEIRQLVKSVIDFLASPDIAVDEQHGPKLHSRFLKGLLASPLAQVFPPTNRTPKSAQASPMQESQPIAASSPESAGILTPAPNQAATSFDMFTATNPFSPVQPVGVAGNADFSMDDLFNPPLPGYDDAIFQSMQTLSQPVQWQDITSGESIACYSTSSYGGSDWFSQISNSNPQVASNTYGQYWPTQ